jgi:hypothetical protein
MVQDNPLEIIKRNVLKEIPSNIFPAKIKSVDESKKTCVVVDEYGLERFDVRLTAIEGTGDFFVKPSLNSDVLCGVVGGNKVDCYVVSYSDIDELIFFGGAYGGLIKQQQLRTQLDKVTQILQAIKTICITPIPEPGNGSPSAFQAALNTALSTLLMPDYSGIENDKIKHG